MNGTRTDDQRRPASSGDRGRLTWRLTSTRPLSPIDRRLSARIVAFASSHTAATPADQAAGIVLQAVLVSCPSIHDLTVTVDRGARSVRRGLRRENLDIHTEPNKPFGHVDVIDEHQLSGLYVLHIAPRCEIGWHRHDVMHERELILTAGLVGGVAHNARPTELAVDVGTIVALDLGVPHRYRNPTSRWQRVLCIDSPRFIPADEIMLGDSFDVARTRAAPS